MAARAAGKVASAISSKLRDGSYAVRPIGIGIDDPMEGLGDKMVDGFADMLERMQALADKVTFRAPAVAMGGVVPYAAAFGGHGSAGAGDGEGQMSELIGLLRQYVSRAEEPQRGGETRVVADVNGRTLFDIVIAEGRARRKGTGRNPFTEL